MSTDDPLPLPDDATATAADGPPGEDSIFAEGPLPDLPAVTESSNPLARRRRHRRQAGRIVGRVLEELGCEAAILLMPAHVAWFTRRDQRPRADRRHRAARRLHQRPQRWLVCSNVDTQRLFDEELDRLGFQLKEWQWVGRPGGAARRTRRRQEGGRRPAVPRHADGQRPAAAGAATAVGVRAGAVPGLGPGGGPRGRGDGPDDGAAARPRRRSPARSRTGCYHRGAEADGDQRDRRRPRGDLPPGRVHRRGGRTPTCVIQATGTRDGLYVTASRTVCFGPAGRGVPQGARHRLPAERRCTAR